MKKEKAMMRKAIEFERLLAYLYWREENTSAAAETPDNGI